MSESEEEQINIKIDSESVRALKRERRDDIFTWIIVLVECAILISVFYAVSKSMPNKLGMGVDFRGMVCGESPLTNRQYLYKLIPNTDSNIQICVSQCPTVSGPNICLYKSDGSDSTEFCYVQTSSFNLGYFCIQKEFESRATLDNYLMNPGFVLERYLQNLLQSTSAYIVSLIVGVVVLVLLKRLTNYIQGITTAILTFGEVTIFIYAYLSYGQYWKLVQQRCIYGIDKYSCAGTMGYDYYNICIFLLVVGALYVLAVAKHFNEINLGCRMLKQSVVLKETLEQVGIFIYGYGACLLALLGFCVWGLSRMATLYTKELISGAISGNLLYVLNRADSSMLLLMINLLLMIILISVFKSFFEGVLVISFSLWYFLPTSQKHHLEVMKGILTLVRFHLGSINLHGIIVAISWPLLYPLKLIIFLLRLKWVNQISCINKCSLALKRFYEKISNFKIENLIFSGILGQSYMNSQIFRQEIKNKNYEKIYQSDGVIQILVEHLAFAFALINSLLYYILIGIVDPKEYQFRLGISVIGFLFNYLLFQVILIQYTLVSKVIAYLGIVDLQRVQGDFADMIKDLTKQEEIRNIFDPPLSTCPNSKMM